MKKKSGLADSPFFTSQLKAGDSTGSSALIFQASDNKSQPLKPKANVIRSDEAHASHGASEAYEPHEAYGSYEARKIIRRPVQMYEDQLKRMREVRARSVLEGKPMLLSQVFQEAIEEYLQKRETNYPKR